MSNKNRNYFGKRVFDIALCMVAIVILSPVLLGVFILIRSIDGKPAIFVQSRVGADGKLFKLYKFRSMPICTSDRSAVALGDVKLSKLGAIIRRANLDELPQLYNILNGTMSIVGPRPAIPAQKKLIKLRKHNKSIVCQPGLTGVAQINSYDGMSDKAKSEFDREYYTNMSFFLDCKVILKTFRYIMKPPPVY